ncbi:MAG: efflux RND transporter periplasmic adaptor subunit [Planctomycetota bacterium]|jgi:RND family efflux transporter MFP subunit|nr:efflux RND transporter periplasmic adaptor subunit [Planctomycetota bacterium]
MSTPPIKKKKNRLVLPILLVIVAGGLWSGLRDGGWMNATAIEEIEGQAVQRGPLRITVVQRGNLSAKNSVKVTNELEGNVQILSLVEEGKEVDEGDLLVVLDTSSLEDRENAGEIAVQNADAALTTAKQDKEIQVSQNTSDFAKAEQDLQFARDDEVKYLEGDFEQQKAAAEEAILLADQELSQAKDRYDKSTDLNEEGFLTATELESDRLSWERSKVKLLQARRAQKLLLDYDYKKQVAVHKGKIEEAERELKRVELQSAARLVNAESKVRTSQAKYDLEKEKLDKLRDQLNKSKIYSPSSGIVVYTRERSRWGQGDLIEEGATVRERQEIITIPQSGGMIAEVSLHESVIKKVAPGQACTIRVDSIPDKDFHGVVDFVALLPDSGSSWMNPNQRLFRTNIAILDTDPEMRPGTSCSVEILVKEIPDALFIPIQGVFHSGGQAVAFVDGKPREVEVGSASEEWVEILGGLEEGEVVQLAPPRGFQPEPPPKGEDDEVGGPPSGSGSPSGRPAGSNSGSGKPSYGGGKSSGEYGKK